MISCSSPIRPLRSEDVQGYIWSAAPPTRPKNATGADDRIMRFPGLTIPIAASFLSSTLFPDNGNHLFSLFNTHRPPMKQAIKSAAHARKHEASSQGHATYGDKVRSVCNQRYKIPCPRAEQKATSTLRICYMRRRRAREGSHALTE